MEKFDTSLINFFSQTLQRNGYRPSEIHQLLVNAWGEEKIIGYRQIVRHCEGAVGENFHRKEGSGRRTSIANEENVDLVRSVVNENDSISLRQLVTLTGISKSTGERILKEKLNLRSVSAKWVPYNLTDGQCQLRVQMCVNLVAELEKRNAAKNIIVCDEKWIYFRSVPHPTCLRKWLPKDGSGDERRAELARRSQGDQKVHMIFACNFMGDSYYELLNDGGSVNSARYVTFIQNAIQNFDLNNIELHNMKWMHDNARPHVSALTRTFLSDVGLTLIPQPPYSPDLNLNDRYVFRNLESARSKCDFNSVDEIREFIDNYSRRLTAAALRKELQGLRDHCQQVIEKDGHYV